METEPRTIVLSGEEAAEVFSKQDKKGNRARAQHVIEKTEQEESENVRESEITNLRDALRPQVYTWHTPSVDEPVTVKFRRPPGGTREMVWRVLGPEQCNNEQLLNEYMALASIIEINGKARTMPNSIAKFRLAKQLVGWIGPAADDWRDEAVALFVAAHNFAMFPDRYEAIADAEAAGLSPDDIKNIAKMAGLERPKG